MGGALGALAPLCEAGVVCVVCPRAALAKTAKTKAVPIRMIGLLLVVSLPPPGGRLPQCLRAPFRARATDIRGSRPRPVRKNELRPTPGLLRMSYLTLALCAS